MSNYDAMCKCGHVRANHNNSISTHPCAVNQCSCEEFAQQIPVKALVAQLHEQRIAPPIIVKFEQPQLTDQQIADMAAQLEADIQQALLKLLEDNGGRIPYNDQTSEAAQKIVAEAYNRICEQYGLVTISVIVEL